MVRFQTVTSELGGTVRERERGKKISSNTMDTIKENNTQ
jgi:hypothetical protein